MSFVAGAPGYHIVEDLIAEGDKVAGRITAYGKHEGDLFGIPATGKEIWVTGMAIWRIADGKIVEHWHETDQLGLLQQLGVSRHWISPNDRRPDSLAASGEPTSASRAQHGVAGPVRDDPPLHPGNAAVLVRLVADLAGGRPAHSRAALPRSQTPLRPPLLCSSRISPMTMPRSTALSMS